MKRARIGQLNCETPCLVGATGHYRDVSSIITIASGRFGPSKKVAGISALLASKDGAFINGQVINMGRGTTI